MITVCDSATRTCATPVVVSPGIVPPWPAPAHVTCHEIVTVTLYAPPGALAEERTYRYPQSGEAAIGSVPGRHGVPGPWQTTESPLPIDHTAWIGVAVAVTLIPGTDAVADCGRHEAGSNDNHDGSPTSWSPEGFTRIATSGSVSRARACRANTCGDTTGGAPAIQTGPPKPVVTSPGPVP